MWTVSQKFTAAMATSHQIVVRAAIWRGGKLIADNVDIVSGTINVDGKSAIRRTADVTIAMSENLSLVKESEFLPNGAEIALYRGVDFGNGNTEFVPVGVFRIDTATLSRPALTLQLRCSDRAIMLSDDRFLVPEPAKGKTVKDELIRLATESVPNLVVHDRVTANLAMWQVTWEEDRWGAIDKLAKSLNAVAYFDPTGALVIGPETPKGTPSWTFTAGKGGTVTSMTTTLSRLDAYNAVVVVGGDPMGEAPVPPQVAKDLDPKSPTFWDGPFGHRPKFYSSQFINTPAEALKTAQEMLAKETGLQRDVTLTAVPHPALDAGDLVEVVFPNGVRENHVIERLSFSLGADSQMTVNTRSLAGVTP